MNEKKAKLQHPAVASKQTDPVSMPTSWLHSCKALQPSRRRFMQTALAIPTAAVLSSCHQRETDTADLYPVFFTNKERQFIDAATARLIPSGSDGSGAKESAVGTFIDRQLAGPYGRADSWYMQGPWAKGTDQQGWQLEYTPAQLYRVAIRNVEAYCRDTYNDKSFAALTPEEQDKVLTALEKGQIKLADVPADAFFLILWQNTQEGFLADPMYGGNRNFIGWKLIGFPGPRYNYVDEVTQYGSVYALPPVGVLGRDGTRTL